MGEKDQYVMGFTDIHGSLKVLHLRGEEPGTEFFDGSSITGYAPIEDSDLWLEPVDNTDTVRTVNGNDFTFCDILTADGEPYPGSPRNRLKAVEAAYDHTVKVGAEPEFFLFDEEEEPVDDAGYWDLASPAVTEILNGIADQLDAAGIPERGFHSEVEHGQWEVKADYTDKSLVAAADDLVLCKELVRRAAADEDVTATFMPKPLENKNGSGMHLHFSLWDDDENLFAASENEHGLSDTAYQFAAGIFDHADALSAVVSPTVNSYKRLVPGKEAPTKVAAGAQNRSALIRFPAVEEERVEDAARIEYRAPDPSANPYLAFAAVLAAGMDGIERGLELSLEYSDQNIYEEETVPELPASLDAALDALEEDDVVWDALGPVAEPYIAEKRAEVERYRESWEDGEPGADTVTDFEWEEYLHV